MKIDEVKRYGRKLGLAGLIGASAFGIGCADMTPVAQQQGFEAEKLRQQEYQQRSLKPEDSEIVNPRKEGDLELIICGYFNPSNCVTDKRKGVFATDEDVYLVAYARHPSNFYIKIDILYDVEKKISLTTSTFYIPPAQMSGEHRCGFLKIEKNQLPKGEYFAKWYNGGDYMYTTRFLITEEKRDEKLGEKNK